MGDLKQGKKQFRDKAVIRGIVVGQLAIQKERAVVFVMQDL